jgi:glycogen(starch) synthase
MAEPFEQVTGLAVRYPPRPYHPWFPRIAWEFFIERYMCQQADHLALVAEYFGPQVQEYYGVSPDKCTVTYNGSDLVQSAPRDASEVNASYGFDAEAKVVLYAGRLDWVKRAHLLVQAMPGVLEHEPRARLLLAGDGDQVADLKVLVARTGLEEHVTFAGWVPHQRLLDIYGFADCLCLPSIWEGLSKVLLEAMSMDVPVLGSDIPANRELFRGEEYGWLVDEPTPSSWAAALCEVLGNPDEANRRAQRAAKLVEREYRWQHVAERLDKAYEQVLAKD